MAQYKSGSGNQLVSAFPAQLNGVFISSATAGTLAIFDSASSLTFTPTLIASFSPNTTVCWYPMGNVQAQNGLNVSIGGTVSYMVAFD